MTELVDAFSMLGVEPPNEEGQTSFSKLSQEAQDAIVWAAMSGDDEAPPKLSDAVRDEIRQWASESREIEVGTPVSPDAPPRRSRRAELPHRAPQECAHMELTPSQSV
jgi:hypothetical protein